MGQASECALWCAEIRRGRQLCASGLIQAITFDNKYCNISFKIIFSHCYPHLTGRLARSLHTQIIEPETT